MSFQSATKALPTATTCQCGFSVDHYWSTNTVQCLDLELCAVLQKDISMWPNSNDTMHRQVADGVKSFPEKENKPQKTNLTRGEINPSNSSTTIQRRSL